MGLFLINYLKKININNVKPFFLFLKIPNLIEITKIKINNTDSIISSTPKTLMTEPLDKIRSVSIK